jgi:hypothetical protein
MNKILTILAIVLLFSCEKEENIVPVISRDTTINNYYYDTINLIDSIQIDTIKLIDTLTIIDTVTVTDTLILTDTIRLDPSVTIKSSNSWLDLIVDGKEYTIMAVSSIEFSNFDSIIVIENGVILDTIYYIESVKSTYLY